MTADLKYLAYLSTGLKITLGVGACALVVTLMVSIVVGVIRAERVPLLSGMLRLYVELFRGTSLLVQLFWLFYCLPLVGINIPPFAAGVAAIGLNSGAYGSEIVRGALLAVSPQQVEAAASLGLRRWQILKLVSLPQALRETVPAFGNVAIAILKDTSLVSLISLADVAFKAQQLRSYTYDSTNIYIVTLLMYFAASLVLVLIRNMLSAGMFRAQAKGAS